MSSQWWNPSTWFNNVSFRKEGKDSVYTLTNNSLGQFVSCFQGAYSEANMVFCFQNIPELFGIIDIIATRVKNGEFSLVKESDGSEVTNNALWNQVRQKPNWQFTFRDFVWHYVLYKYTTGNVYGYAYSPSTMTLKHSNIMAIWLLPSHYMQIRMKPQRPSYLTTLKPADYIDSYLYNGDGLYEIKPDYVTHQVLLKMGDATDIVTGKGVSPFKAAEYPLSNIVAVYKARNVIYVDRGPGGLIVSRKTDAGGNIALTPKEKQEVIDDLKSRYGLDHGKTPFGVSSQPVDWLKTGATISELQPFEEVKASTAAVAGVAGVPMALIPKVAENKQTNLDISERSFYENTIIALANDFCMFLTDVCRFSEIGCKVSVSFDHILAMQDDQAQKATALMNAADGALQLYNAGKITINELRQFVGLEPLPSGGDQFISPEELARLQPQSSSQQQQTGNDA